jgi:hypothetical protein
MFQKSIDWSGGSELIYRLDNLVNFIWDSRVNLRLNLKKLIRSYNFSAVL